MKWKKKNIFLKSKMDTIKFVNDNFEFPVNKKSSMDNVTPHKIAVIAFIREYGLLKMESKTDADCVIAPKYRKDFCILALKLIQCPDMEFKEFENLLTDGRYNLSSVHLQNFCVSLQNIYVNGVSALVDCVVSAIDKLMIEQCDTIPCLITRSSVLGFYLRRVSLYLDKLTFVQLGALYKSFCVYYQKGRPGLMIRSLSKEKLNIIGVQNVSAPQDESNLQQESMRMPIIDRDHAFEGQWSRKQAELFAAQQANLLQINEQRAMPAKQLQKTINDIIHDIPDYSDIHFLSFLNCIRMKEFCGAQDSLYNCFDRSVPAWRGDAALAAALASWRRAPLADLVARRAAAVAALLAGKWVEAEISIEQLASSDRWESRYLYAELYFLMGNPTDAIECLNEILEDCKTDADSLHFVSLRLRSMILMAQVYQSFEGTNARNDSSIIILNDALSIAKKYNLHYLAATAEMNIANVLLHMGCAKGSLNVVRGVLPTILAHGGAYDTARGLVLYSKCRAAAAPERGPARARVLRSCCAALDAARDLLRGLDARARLLPLCYLQAQLYNELGNTTARNQCAWMYRQLETQNPEINYTNGLLMY